MRQERKSFAWTIVIAMVLIAGIYAVYRYRERANAATEVTAALAPVPRVPSAPVPENMQPAAPAAHALDLDSAVQGQTPPGTLSVAPPVAPQSADAASEQREQAMQAALRKMQSLLSSGQHDGAALSSAIAQAEKANGSPIMSGVNLETLRHNIEIASQMQQITQQMAALQNAPNDASQPDAQKLAALHDKQLQMQALVKQLNPNIMQSAPDTSTSSEQGK
ncbi:hypothetical protein LGM43_35605 [Burkholderia seminalis]|uniref:hypothetical protein n=1 Tax=Burkholderia seminalis TaxID=488731 RepID=UPI001CF4E54B|nr:hypothetical protein [Burkholderia seminalis]MCA7955584.1 hypothetical protein [Burkholderia seminalis]